MERSGWGWRWSLRAFVIFGTDERRQGYNHGHTSGWAVDWLFAAKWTQPSSNSGVTFLTALSVSNLVYPSRRHRNLLMMSPFLRASNLRLLPLIAILSAVPTF